MTSTNYVFWSINTAACPTCGAPSETPCEGLHGEVHVRRLTAANRWHMMQKLNDFLKAAEEYTYSVYNSRPRDDL
jgi:hypothetical protein